MLASAGLLAYSSQTRRLQELTSLRALAYVTKGTYINLVTTPAVEIAEAAASIRSGAVVSLHSVLGEFGVLNNHTDHVTAIIPLGGADGTAAMPRLGGVATPAGTFTFYGMSAKPFFAGGYEDRLILGRLYPCATPERAFLDHLYLGESGRSRLPLPPFDCDVGELDQARLWRLAAAMELEQALESWMKQKDVHDEDEDVINNMSLRLGF
jgi:hypothetical protein